ncbi:ImcF-related family protein [Paraburkholderia sp. J11-2]|uniref:ImcF-related family protein n=1 Tax=Paraburkholderia sp. J11-2 TaxID=2805431 RepID=UPI002AB6E01D|nr:ImcF-related family protein [Paraburkholderia sp. J11-2]
MTGNESKSGSAAPFYVGLALTILFWGVGLAVWFEGLGQGWPSSTRIIIVLVLVIIWLALLILIKFFELILLQIATLRAARWLTHYDVNHRAGSAGQQAQAGDESVPTDFADSLRQMLRERHGFFWRYRESWVLVAGDLPIVKRIAPGLAELGYAFTGDTILLYANQTSTTIDTSRLDQIRQLRRRRPVDAIVAVARASSSVKTGFEADAIAQRLGRHARALRWAAPVYLLNATEFDGDPSIPDEPIGFTWSTPRVHAEDLDRSLNSLSHTLADAGVIRLIRNRLDRYPALLSQHIDARRTDILQFVTQMAQSRYWRLSIHGLLFAPLFKAREAAGDPRPPEGSQEKLEAKEQPDETGTPETVHRTVWQFIADHSRNVHGRRVGFSFSTAATWVATAAVGLWTVGMMISGFSNRATINTASGTLEKLTATTDRTQSLQLLDSLDKQIDTLEYRQQHGAPWITRFGLNHDRALLDALWPGYDIAASRVLVAPMREKLEERLRQLASLTDAEIASGGEAQAQAAYDTLKTYLMLAQPTRALASFLTPQLIATDVPARPLNAPISAGTWQDLREHTITFFANHIGHPVSAGAALAITPDAGLVASARQTVIGVRGIQNSTDTLYQQIITEAQSKYPPVTLATLLGDTTSRGLFTTSATIPGVFTRAAWDERISKAIDDASGQREVAGDWVLSDVQANNAAPSALRDALRQRYFDDYLRAWAVFLNSMRWQSAPSLTGTVDQLTLLGDPQRSPLVALMNVIAYQAAAGASSQSLSDTLIRKAQQLVGGGEKDPSKQPQAQAPVAPLAAGFGPILRLTGSDLVSGAPAATGKDAARLAATSDLSLARYLERVTAMRLKAQQIASSPDAEAMSRQAAQAVLQGRPSDIADSREYASRLAASLGEQWAGFGELFRAPLDQNWRVVVQPAAASLNDIWRRSIVADWNRSFGGRYPFFDSDNEASLPEMARIMRPDNGVITQFVTTQLAGVVERQGDRWVAVQGANRGSLTLDPAFLDGLNRLTRVANVLFPTGDAHLRFELRGVPTPGITDMRIVLSGNELHYFNQREEWQPFEWPGQALENISHIEWQTAEGGLRSAFDAQGRFGLIRLLERAQAEQQDSARWLLTWKPDASQAVPLRVLMRSEAGTGPLDVLKLRHFTLPERIFISASPSSGTAMTGASPPPLPAAAIAAGKRAATPLPGGAAPEDE